MTFEELGLSPEVLQAVTDAGYKEPTPIQAQAIPYVLMGRDILGSAQTGTGKTASFTLPMIDILASGRAKARMPRSLIIEPTRELAQQVAKNFETYGKYNKLTMALLIGGESFGPQMQKLDRGVDVLIATPGRLLDHFERGGILLNDVKILVIDEADRMLDMGFIPDVEKIASIIPKIRQTLFFSATFPPEVKRLADAFLMNPKEIAVAAPSSTADTVEAFLVKTSARMKRETLRHVIGSEQVQNALIFCNRKRDVDVLATSLRRHGFKAAGLHGDMAQAQRTATLQSFRDGEINLLVATDVAGRGIDIRGLSHVFNFDVPFHAEDYVHRIGRTGRAGLSGRAITLTTSDDGKFLDAIQSLIKKQIPVLDAIPGEPEAAAEPEAPHAEGEAESGRGRGRERGGRGRGRTDHRRHAQRENSPETPREIVAREQQAPAREVTPSEQPAPSRDVTPREVTAREATPREVPTPPRAANSQNGDRKVVVGLGDHVPAFLQRPVRRSAAS
ncbi:MAG TPA: DEAD/DEAH box helicase [Alphaproteobacteria bacterium]|jgi:superfamily II DNA/RNA helicase|nr:DEAD/DEAH box helicase [Alphaproteobacteria bacterium]